MMVSQRKEQPELFDLWGQRFYGKAYTITGDIWWYESNRKRFPLCPVLVTADVSGAVDTTGHKLPTGNTDQYR